MITEESATETLDYLKTAMPKYLRAYHYSLLNNYFEAVSDCEFSFKQYGLGTRYDMALLLLGERREAYLAFLRNFHSGTWSVRELQEQGQKLIDFHHQQGKQHGYSCHLQWKTHNKVLS